MSRDTARRAIGEKAILDAAKELHDQTRATLTAFGMTRRVGRSAENDDTLAAVLDARTPDDFAAEEGEGDLSRTHWAAVHQDCFTREGTYAPDMMLWCERFRLVEIIGEGADQ